MPSLQDIIYEVSSRLKVLKAKNAYLTEISALVDVLNSYFFGENSAKVKRVSRQDDLSAAREAELKTRIRELFEVREKYLNLGGLLKLHGVNPVDLILEDLARAVAEPEESILKIMYPSLEVDYYSFCDADLKTLTEDAQRKIQAHRFIFTEDRKAIIPLKEWFKMQGGKEDLPFVFHLYGMTESGFYNKDDYEQGRPLTYLPLTPTEKADLIQATRTYGQAIFDEIERRKKNIPPFFEEALKKLALECRAHGASTHMRNENGVATEGQAHPELTPKIRTFLEEAWGKLTPAQREQFSAVTDDSNQLGDYIILLRWGIYDPLTPEEEESRKEKNVMNCVEVAAGAIERMLSQHFRKYSFNALQEKALAFLEKPPDQILANREEIIWSVSLKKLELLVPGYLSALNKRSLLTDYSQLPYSSQVLPSADIFKVFDINRVFRWSMNADCDALLKLCIANGVDLNRPDDFGQTPLFWAIKHSKTEIFHELMSKGARVDYIAASGLTAFHLAAGKVSQEYIQRMLKDPRAITVIDAPDPSGHRVIDKFGSEKLTIPHLNTLYELIDLGATFDPQATARLLVCDYRVKKNNQLTLDHYLKVLDLCLDKGLDPDDLVDESMTFLQFCIDNCSLDHANSVKLLTRCITKKTDLSQEDLCYILSSEEEVLDFCIKKGVDFNRAYDSTQSYLQYAFSKSLFRAVIKLLSTGCSVREIYNDEYFGTLCITASASNKWIHDYPLADGRPRCILKFRQDYEYFDRLVKAILKAGADPELRIDPVCGHTVLHLMVQYKLSSSFEYYLEEKKNLNAMDNQNNYAIDLAYKLNRKSSFLALFEAGAKYSMSDQDLLHYAITENCASLAWKLLLKGERSAYLNPYWVDAHGTTEFKAWARLHPEALGCPPRRVSTNSSRLHFSYNQDAGATSHEIQSREEASASIGTNHTV